MTTKPFIVAHFKNQSRLLVLIDKLVIELLVLQVLWTIKNHAPVFHFNTNT